jgi:glyceraldehyde 3-phosphate dehydrogenase
MKKRIAINGFGRIGRLAFRQFMGVEELEVVSINDVAPLDNLAYLLRHDTVHVDPDPPIEAGDDVLRWGEKEIRYTQIRNPDDLPWDELDVDIAIEAAGLFRRREDAAKHLEAGAKRVIITAPSKSADLTVCMGVNEARFNPEQHVILSNASCTTNCLAPVAKVLNEEFGIVTGLLTTVHAVTKSQSTVDASYRKWTRGRSAVANIVPTTTGAAIATTLVLPELEGKLDGVAMRVPVPDGSIIDFVIQTKRPLTVDAVNDAFRRAAETDALRGILGVSEEPLVSSDIIGSTYSALVDAQSTMVLGEHTAKVLAWYDNEWGYARRVVDLALYISEQTKERR